MSSYTLINCISDICNYNPPLLNPEGCFLWLFLLANFPAALKYTTIGHIRASFQDCNAVHLLITQHIFAVVIVAAVANFF